MLTAGAVDRFGFGGGSDEVCLILDVWAEEGVGWLRDEEDVLLLTPGAAAADVEGSSTRFSDDC